MPQPLFATKGKDFNATVTWVRTRKREGFDFYMVNTHTKKTAAPFVAIRKHDLSTAEVITERPTVNHRLRKLLNYRSIFDTGEVTWGTSGAGLFGQAPHSQVVMIDSAAKTMSYPGNILGLGSWYMHFHRCS